MLTCVALVTNALEIKAERGSARAQGPGAASDIAKNPPPSSRYLSRMQCEQLRPRWRGGGEGWLPPDPATDPPPPKSQTPPVGLPSAH